jgi:hypothetical protein
MLFSINTWISILAFFLESISSLLLVASMIEDISGFSYGETNQIDEDSAWKADTGGE